MPPKSPYRPEFEAALHLLARISSEMDAAGYRPPVLVGGGAVEIYTRGAVTTGDFDLSCGRQDVLEEHMQRHGFVRPSGPGMATRGWVHPELKLGFECVSDTLLDGSGHLHPRGTGYRIHFGALPQVDLATPLLGLR